MIDFDQFKECLREALLQLHNPASLPPAFLYEVLGCDAEEGVGPLQTAIVAAIVEQKPSPDTPIDVLESRRFTSLYFRFVLGRTQESTAAQLHVSVRHAQRIQAEAVHTLARRLWNRWRSLDRAEMERVGDGAPPAMLGDAPPETSDWHAQAEREMAILSQRDPQATAQVAEVIKESVELFRVLAAQYDLRIDLNLQQPALKAEVHPSALRQTLITALTSLAPHVNNIISIYAGLEDGSARITLTGPERVGGEIADDKILYGIVMPPRASAEVRHADGHVFLWIIVPPVGARTVLVVEDNPDMVHFFRRATVGTPYRIIHTDRGAEVSAIVEATSPDVVVLDVMLPDVDGWKLLTYLRQDAATRSMPLIVCSVIREEQLARALGADYFLAKPFQARHLVEALNQVLRQTSERLSRDARRRPASC